MARQEEVTAWILRSDERLDLRVQELSWIKSVFPGWQDLQVSISAFGEHFVGRGSDREVNTALGKAVCEAVERATCYSYGILSLGVAGHVSLELAQKNARLEYVERFCFSRQIAERISLEPISQDAAVTKRYESLGIEIGFFLLASPTETPVVLCLASGENADPAFGGILGLGAATNLKVARQKALMETLRSLEFHLLTKRQSLSREDFQRIEHPQAQERQALLRDRHYFTQLMASLNQPRPIDLKMPEGRFEALALDNFFKDCPLVFTRYSTSLPLTQPEFLA